MPLSEHARRYLISEGVKPETIIKTGSTMFEVLEYYKNDIKNSTILDVLQLQKKSYFLVSTHREENIDSNENIKDLLETLNALVDQYDKRIIISTHPRTRKKIENTINVKNNPKISFLKPFGFSDYIKLQKNAYCVISDSGTITEESSIIGFPAITIRQAHERPEGMDNGTLVMTGLKKNNVLDAIDIVLKQYNDEKFIPKLIDDYSDKNVSSKVVRIILSYIDYINRTVWFKN
jgi:UDP-N-acetylglucosamine 2-epimerase (non-hydrolysing)